MIFSVSVSKQLGPIHHFEGQAACCCWASSDEYRGAWVVLTLILAILGKFFLYVGEWYSMTERLRWTKPGHLQSSRRASRHMFFLACVPDRPLLYDFFSHPRITQKEPFLLQKPRT